ncbi:hypothetical protein SDC9_203507 [bioreactor metagenome]|uniref:Uncharacterized protein n=1 Tax=bioreactor metagenome TaxID=1076179 RepID=A0A645J8K4_9ZZZZ
MVHHVEFRHIIPHAFELPSHQPVGAEILVQQNQGMTLEPVDGQALPDRVILGGNQHDLV